MVGFVGIRWFSSNSFVIWACQKFARCINIQSVWSIGTCEFFYKFWSLLFEYPDFFHSFVVFFIIKVIQELIRKLRRLVFGIQGHWTQIFKWGWWNKNWLIRHKFPLIIIGFCLECHLDISIWVRSPCIWDTSDNDGSKVF